MWIRLKHTHSFWAQSELLVYQLHQSLSVVRRRFKCSSYHTGLIFNCQQSGMVSTDCFCQHISVLNVHRTRTKPPRGASCSAGSWPCLRLLLKGTSLLSHRRVSLPGELKASIFLETFWNHCCLISSCLLSCRLNSRYTENRIINTSTFKWTFLLETPMLSPKLIFLRLHVAFILKKMY